MTMIRKERTSGLTTEAWVVFVSERASHVTKKKSHKAPIETRRSRPHHVAFSFPSFETVLSHFPQFSSEVSFRYLSMV